MVKIYFKLRPGFTLECKNVQIKVHRLWKMFNQIGIEET